MKIINDHFNIIGCPRILRSDLGTENSLVSVMQPILRHYHTDSLAGPKSFLYGRSVNNQVMLPPFLITF